MVIGMDLFAILAICSAISDASPDHPQAVSQAECESARAAYRMALQSIELSQEDRDAMARVSFAEAANQGDSGLAGVVYTLLNRLISGRFGTTVTDIVNAPGEFEPVTTAGGWRNLPAPSLPQRAQINTIINLALESRLPDPTNGALFFQNPAIVAEREAAGTVSKGTTHFGNAAPSAVIRDHTFYPQKNKPTQPVRAQAKRRPASQAWDVFGVAQEQALKNTQAWDVFAHKAVEKERNQTTTMKRVF